MKKNKTAEIFHFDLYGTREAKYEFLNNNSVSTINWEQLNPTEPNNFFVKKDFTSAKDYEAGFKVDELYIQNNAGFATEFDDFVIKDSLKQAEKLLLNLKSMTSDEISTLYGLSSKKIKKIENAIMDIQNNKPIVTALDYRPFDNKYTVYTGVSNGIMGRPRDAIMKHMLKNNLSLLTCRQQTTFNFQHVFISNKISERCSVSLQTGEVNYIFPLYLYSDNNSERTPNLNSEIVQKIADGLGLKFTNEKENTTGTFAPIDILDYIYAVLHSPTYREKYKEFLKIDFPRVPYPKDKEKFWSLVKLGGELRQIHLLESPVVEKYITQYPVGGDNVVEKPKFVNSKVYINDTQYFEGVPEVAWNFFIGGYQPAQKWLKDRKGRKLEFDDILHYQKIIVALTETDRIMKEVDEVGME